MLYSSNNTSRVSWLWFSAKERKKEVTILTRFGAEIKKENERKSRLPPSLKLLEWPPHPRPTLPPPVFLRL